MSWSSYTTIISTRLKRGQLPAKMSATPQKNGDERVIWGCVEDGVSWVPSQREDTTIISTRLKRDQHFLPKCLPHPGTMEMKE